MPKGAGPLFCCCTIRLGIRARLLNETMTEGSGAEMARSRIAKQLGAFYRRNGYVRWQNVRRQRNEPHASYKKGDEVRLVAESRAELRLIRRLLGRTGFRVVRPFIKGRQYRQPLYGRDEVRRFLQLIGESARTKRPGRS